MNPSRLKTRLPVALLSLIASASIVSAQAAPDNIFIPYRMSFRAITENKISSKRAKVGDKVRMLVLSPEKLDDGTVIPADARITGHVTEVVAHSDDKPGSRLTVVLDQLQWKKHKVPLHAYIVAQGQLRMTGGPNDDKRDCYDTYFNKATIDLAHCAQGARSTSTKDGLATTDSFMSPKQHSSQLREVQLVPLDRPPQSWTMVSPTRDIVIEPNMAFVVMQIPATK